MAQLSELQSMQNFCFFLLSLGLSGHDFYGSWVSRYLERPLLEWLVGVLRMVTG